MTMQSDLPRPHRVFFDELIEKPRDTPEEIAFALLAMANDWDDAELYTDEDKREIFLGAVYMVLEYDDFERSFEG